MINRINLISNTPFVSKPSFKSKNETTPNEIMKEEKFGTEAITSYGISAIKFNQKFDVKPERPIMIDPNQTHSIKGDRIYTSEGRLYNITDENEKTKTVYIPNQNDERFFDSITTTDKETGNIIKIQTNYINDGKYEHIVITKYSAKDGKVELRTEYENGEPYSATKYNNKENGTTECIAYNYKNQEYTWSQRSANGKINKTLTMTKDLKLANFYEGKVINNKEIYKEAEFYNGGLISTLETKRTTFPNLLGYEPLQDIDLTPAKKLNLDSIKPDFEGKKTYYSNNAIESITIPDGKAYFTPDGNILKLISPTKEVEIVDNKTQIIKEKLSENETRTTTYFEDGGIEIYHKKDNLEKKLVLDNKSKPVIYTETDRDENIEESEYKSYFYKNGILDSVYSS